MQISTDFLNQDLRAIEFTLKQMLSNVVRPEIEKRVKQQKIDSYKKQKEVSNVPDSSPTSDSL
jgi:hypothetical protein